MCIRDRYDTNPYTLGRPFDYILFKEWNINNYYEGEQIRNINNSDFIINFSKDTVQLEDNNSYEYFLFDQIRLTVKR